MKDNVFGFGRFGNLMRWLAVSQGNQLLRKAASMTAVFLLMELMLLVITGDYDAPWVLQSMLGMCAAVYLFVVLSFFSRYLSSVRDKRKRIGLLMLPATNAEKFVAMFLWTVVIGAAAMLVSMAVADSLRWIVCQLLRWHTPLGSGIPYFLTHLWPSVMFGGNMFSTTTPGDVASCVFFHVWVVWHSTLFLLAGTLFRRMPTFVAFAVSAFLLFLGMYCLTILPESVYEWSESNDMQAAVCISILTAAFVAEGLLNVWLSYRLFCRLTLGGGRWLNF